MQTYRNNRSDFVYAKSVTRILRVLLLPYLLGFVFLPVLPAYAIINGDPVDAKAYTSYVSIRGISPFPSQKGKEVNSCGGVLVASHWILTAAHCRPVYEDLDSREDPVVVGVHIQENGAFAGRLRVVDYFFAPALLGSERVDAALLKLDGDATQFGATVATVLEEHLVEGLPTITVGLGLGITGTPLMSYASLVTAFSYCDKPAVDFDPDHDFCVGVPGASQRTGYGDSGGPVYLKADDSNQPILLGVVKGGVKTGVGNQESEYIRYTNSYVLLDWIKRYVSK
ncbi:MAG: hypothetical protein CMP10_16525 [Zetaproteobacteria bacterium]|nr:hypothetical protein [Pseudobdellovibrionaceae bacterium]|tara:strand:+ start:752 stop:1600 length:849 start_codon:yes stop_codon:yes gene_type:complete